MLHAGRRQLNSHPNFQKRGHAQEQVFLILIVDPPEHLLIWPILRRL
jgi:hypothetical protein